MHADAFNTARKSLTFIFSAVAITFVWSVITSTVWFDCTRAD